MTLEHDIRCLKSIALFRDLPPARLKLLTLMSEKLQFDAGTVLIEERQRPDGVFIVLEGEVEISHELPDGRRRSLHLETGSVLGDVPLLCGQGYVGQVAAKTDLKVLRLPRELFFELLDTIPEFSVALSRDLASRLYRLADAVLHREKLLPG